MQIYFFRKINCFFTQLFYTSYNFTSPTRTFPNRYWASVIPIWKCSCGRSKVIGSIEELRKEAINFPKKIDLHKPTMDKVKLSCSCGKEMSRVPEVLDCWFESGAMPFAQ